MVTKMVSNIPDTPLPMLPISSNAVTFPAARVMAAPAAMPTSSTTNTFRPTMPPMSTSTYGMISTRSWPPETAFCTSVPSDTATISAKAASAAGRAILKFARNLSFISVPCVEQAAMVVSEIKLRLSPNIAPPMTEAMHKGRSKPELADTATAMGAKSVMVPTEVPMAMDTKQATTNSTATASFTGAMDSRK